MQTFLPSTSFEQSAKWLDNLRLPKQRIEVYQILKALNDPSYGWQHHPAVTLWRGYQPALIRYGWYICQEWKARGFKDTCEAKILSFGTTFGDIPPWLTEEFASNHRAILLGKVYSNMRTQNLGILLTKNCGLDPNKKQVFRQRQARKQLEWYQQFNWSEEPAKRNEEGKWPYLWVKDETSL